MKTIAFAVTLLLAGSAQAQYQPQPQNLFPMMTQTRPVGSPTIYAPPLTYPQPVYVPSQPHPTHCTTIPLGGGMSTTNCN